MKKQDEVEAKVEAEAGEGFHENLLYYRKLEGYTQESLAQYLGVARSYITHLENGRGNPTLETIERLAFALSIEPWRLLHYK